LHGASFVQPARPHPSGSIVSSSQRQQRCIRSIRFSYAPSSPDTIWNGSMSLADAIFAALGMTGAACVIAGIIQRHAPRGYEGPDGFRFGEQVREIHTPSQLTHRQPGSISERSGKGDEAAFHTTAITTEVDQ
jgi:hypothetical protein